MSFLDTCFGELKYEDSGEWFEFYPHNPDGSVPRIKLRRAHSRNRAYQSGLAALANKIKGLANKDVDDSALGEAYAKYLVVVWENFPCPAGMAETFGIKEGEYIPFSFQNVMRIFEGRPRFFDDIHRKVHDEAAFGEDDEAENLADEESAKN